ncbi:unnamed protein product [Malus baccata var. baccata]
MECNKEEAFKAMQLSEVKMRNSDFTGARKMAQKAQRLFPGIENIEKLLTVCEVHCSSENKIGFEMDWYGILQIQKSDDDVTIKKQYRKLALLLHPDKNKFAGAEAAFKLIGEANRVLTDQAKRSTYDMKCRAQVKTGSSIPSAHPSNGNLFVRKQNDTPQSQFPPDTFWTCCPFCKIKYQYFKDFANRLLRCQKCRRAFVAQDLGIQSQDAHPESVGNQFPNRKEPPNQGTSNAAPQSNGGTGKPSSTQFHYGKATSNPPSKAGIATDVKISQSGPVKSPVKSKDSKTSGNMNKKRGRESSESCKPSELNEGHHHRRSSRIKQNLSYNENLNDDDDFVSPPKRSTNGQFSSDTEMERKNAAADGGVSKNNSQPGCATTAAVGGHKKEAKQKVTRPLEECLPSKRSKTAEFEQKVEEAAMPDKNDDKSKADNANGSSCDISKSKTKPVMSSGKVCAAEKQEKNYSERETSTRRSPRMSNGEFANSVKLEATQGITEDNGTNQGNQTQPRVSSTPRKADESINTPKKHQKNDSDGKSFSLRRSPRDVSKNIPRPNVSVKCPDSANDTSHASFTPTKVNSTSSQAHSSVKDHPSVNSMKIPVAPSSSSPLHILSRSQFYDFDGQRSEDKFRLDQIWALYSDKNGMPRTYAQVKRIVLKPNFQLHVALLEPCLPEDASEPVCCGTFKVKSDQTKVFSRSSFSHCVKAKPIGKTMFEIYPRKGEVWALYKNSGRGECEMVQVLEDNDESTKVAVLPHVNGSKSLFRAPRIHRSKNGIIDIPRAELGRFSHQAPAFLHTGEIDIQLASCWEVDQVSIPAQIRFKVPQQKARNQKCAAPVSELSKPSSAAALFSSVSSSLSAAGDIVCAIIILPVRRRSFPHGEGGSSLPSPALSLSLSLSLIFLLKIGYFA